MKNNTFLTKKKILALVIASSCYSVNSFADLKSLKDEKIVLPNLNGIIVDETAAKQLGKALFWDQFSGSDGMACASCHFAAGADNRTTNALSPGLNDIRVLRSNPEGFSDFEFGGLIRDSFAKRDHVRHDDLSPDFTEMLLPSGDIADSNLDLQPNDFPLHRLADMNDKDSVILHTTNDTVSSQGTFNGPFIDVKVADNDICGPADPSVFHTASNFAARKVEPRNSPTTINSIFNFRNFWDGRANNVFNGVDPFGNRNKNARVLKLSGEGDAELEKLRLENASLASQAVGPTLSDFEMSCAGRIFPMVGRKMLPQRALSAQEVNTNDSLLGNVVDQSGKGLTKDYATMIKEAFDQSYWGLDPDARYSIDTKGDNPVLVEDPNGFTQLELNFSLFWGLSILLYESTLVSDDAPFDKFAEGDLELTDSELNGKAIFEGKGKCINCHDTALFSKATTPHLIGEAEEEGLVERMHMAQGVNGGVNPAALYDNGFYNIGVTPTAHDLGVGNMDPWGNSLSFTRQYLQQLKGRDVPDNFQIDTCTFEVRWGEDKPFDVFTGETVTLGCESDPVVAEVAEVAEAVAPENLVEVAAAEPVEVRDPTTIVPKDPNDIAVQRIAVDGAFKTPLLRNVGLTAPYMHNGGFKSLKEVVKFYNRGGNVRGDFQALARNADGTLAIDSSAQGDTSGTGALGNPISDRQRSVKPDDQGVGSNLDPDIVELGLSEKEEDDLVNFMLTLTDERVACRAAPFDGPSLAIPIRQNDSLSSIGGKRANDEIHDMPAVGAKGLSGDKCLDNDGTLFGERDGLEVTRIGTINGGYVKRDIEQVLRNEENQLVRVSPSVLDEPILLASIDANASPSQSSGGGSTGWFMLLVTSVLGGLTRKRK